jgi:thioredoxin reductase (NADPH)
MGEKLDCVVVGAGPAGLMAGVYLARFRRSLLLLDSGAPRAAWIPRTRNVPSYPNGLTGRMLLSRLRRQAARYGVPVLRSQVHKVLGEDGDFQVRTNAGPFAARKVIIATGVEDVLPVRFRGLHRDRAIQKGRLRLCPVCDAFELIDEPVAVLGRGLHGTREALFLRSYTSRVTLFTDGADPAMVPEEQRRRLRKEGVALVESRITTMHEQPGGLALTLQDEPPHGVRALYVALGVNVRSGIVDEHFVRRDEAGYIETDRRQETSVRGLYAAGDVVQSLSQISVGFGQAAIAASAIHQALRK